jgi:hypothetical protein
METMRAETTCGRPIEPPGKLEFAAMRIFDLEFAQAEARRYEQQLTDRLESEKNEVRHLEVMKNFWFSKMLDADGQRLDLEHKLDVARGHIQFLQRRLALHGDVVFVAPC